MKLADELFAAFNREGSAMTARKHAPHGRCQQGFAHFAW
jgi:hypothetical protein